jgi:ADP-ribose pyrophosphatase YjhB (NUDIX family)
MRSAIRREIERIEPLDETEARAKHDVLLWVDSAAEICRLAKPATPPKHLVSYFVVVDGEYLLLVDHINAGLWLPTGGHVEPQEHPRDTVRREAREELSLAAAFLLDGPLFLTVTETVGRTAGHTDVSLWYVLRGSRASSIDYDRTEFHRVEWFHRDRAPLDRADPELGRFMQKLYREAAIMNAARTEVRRAQGTDSAEMARLAGELG